MHTRNTIVIAALVAACGTAANAQSISWLMPVDGNWNDAANWDGGDVPDTFSEHAVLGLLEPYTVFSTAAFSVGSISIDNPGATLSLGNFPYTLGGDLSNSGTVFVNTNGSNFNSTITFNTDATITGNGSIVLNGISSPIRATITASAGTVLTHQSGHSIRGGGRLQGEMNNLGLIVADNPNTAGLSLSGTLDQGGGGTAGADNGARLILGSNATTIGGELFTINGGEIVAENQHTIDGVNISGDLNIPGSGITLIADGDFTNSGTMSLNPELAVFNAILRLNNSATINGDGTIVMRAPSATNDAQIVTGDSSTAQIGPLQTVRGSGLISGESGGTISNLGTINADDPDDQLQLLGSHLGSGGLYTATNAGVLGLGSGSDIVDAVFDTGATGSVEHNHSGTASISNATNNGLMIVRGQGGTLSIGGVMQNNATISLNPEEAVFNANIVADNTTWIGGTGTILMTATSNVNDARLLARDGAILTLGSGQTIHGSGIINSDSSTGGLIVNLGTINGNHAASGKNPAYTLEINGNHDGQGIGVYRADDGILRFGNGLNITNASFDSSGDGIVGVTTTATATMQDAVNNGSMHVFGQGGTLNIAGQFVNNGQLELNSDMAVFNALVRFEPLASITGNGTVRMHTAGNINDAQLIAEDTVGSIGANQTVAGSGIIEGSGTGIISNSGTITGDDPAAFLQLRGAHNASANAVYRADGDGVLSLGNGVSVNSGIFETTGNGEVAVTGGLSSIGFNTNNGMLGIRGQAATLSLFGPITNNGMIHINSDSAVFNATLRFTGDFEIDGTGTIEMTTAGNSNDAQLAAETGFVGTLGSGQTLTGDGQINGVFNILGTIDPGGPSRLLTTDTIDLDPGSTARLDLGGANFGEFDRISVRSTQTLNLNNATININIEPGFAPQFGDTWDIISGDTTGIFSQVITTNAPIGQVYRPIYENDRVFVILTCDADLTGNGVVDFFDVSAFLGFFNSQDIRGDLNNDGQFNFFDISLFLQLLGKGCSP